MISVFLCVAMAAGLLVALSHRRLPALAPESPTAPPGVRAMWVWEYDSPRAVIDWAAGHGVTTLFVFYDHRRPDPRLAEFKRLADDARIVLDALGGEPGWTTDHATALAWARAAAGSGLFRRLHVDVEPYLLEDWQTRRAHHVHHLLTLLDELLLVGPPVELDVPFWLATVEESGVNLADAVLARADAITVMSYRDTATGPNSTLAVAEDLLRRGGKAAKPVRLGAETQPLADCSYCSFADPATLTATLDAVDTAAQGFAAFSGISVHQYDSWMALSG